MGKYIVNNHLISERWYDTGNSGFLSEDPTPPALTLMPTFSGAEFRSLVNYGVVVEVVYGKGLGGSTLKEFTQSERKLLAKWTSKFYVWEMRTGMPQRVRLRLSTLELLQRAVGFFASV